eukprot:10753321-Alexandrium_andersonii.AAC.1
MAAWVVHMQHAAPGPSRSLYMDDRMVWLRQRADHEAAARALHPRRGAQAPLVLSAIAAGLVEELLAALEANTEFERAFAL